MKELKMLTHFLTHLAQESPEKLKSDTIKVCLHYVEDGIIKVLFNFIQIKQSNGS